MNHLQHHVNKLQEQIDWLSSLTYKVHFNAVTSEFWDKHNSWLADPDKETYIENEWWVDRCKFDDLRKNLKHYQQLLAIRGLNSDRIV